MPQQTSVREKIVFFSFYYLVHVLFCSLYFFGLLLIGGTVALVALATLIVVSSIWAVRWLWRFYHTWRPGANQRTVWLMGVLLICLLAGWVVTFPIYLTYRQWLKRRDGLAQKHFSGLHHYAAWQDKSASDSGNFLRHRHTDV
jgi:hypothetical protein